MTDDRERDTQIEELAGSHRAPDAQGLPVHPAFMDLDEEGRREACARAEQLRAIEAALDPDGLSTTARAVLARIRAERP